MMKKNHVGLMLGTFIGLFHLLWTILVATGIAQTLLNFIYQIHFLNNPFQVKPFEIVTALELVVVTFIVGYVSGWVLTFIWKKIQGNK